MNVHKIILAGGTGFIGQVLINHWKDKPINLVILTRKPRVSQGNTRYVMWDGETPGDWVSELDRADVLINLAGKSVDCRYTKRNKQLIMSSRINATNVLGEAISRVKNPPRLWINSASATIYRHTLDRPMDEATGEIGNDRQAFRFSVQVCQAWEQTFWKADVPDSVRKVALRMAIVFGKEGGVWDVLKRLTRFGLGGTMGRGNQFMSWLHERDLVRMIDFIIENESITGTYNGSAPNPIRNQDFMALLRQSLGSRIGLPATRWMLEIGAVFLRTETELVLKSRNVLPRKLLEAGFQFDFPTAEDAITDLSNA